MTTVSPDGGREKRYPSGVAWTDVDDVDDVGAPSLQPAIATMARRGIARNRKARMEGPRGRELTVGLAGRRPRGCRCPPHGGGSVGCRKKPKTRPNQLIALL